MKKLTILLFSVLLVSSLASCNLLFKSNTKSSNDRTAAKVKNGTVTIESIPKTYDAFEELYNEVAIYPEGCVALGLLAMEIYRVNPSVGVKCLKLVNTDTNYNMMMRRLPEIFREGDGYARPYLVASYMDGASPENGYNPTKPYVIRVQANPAQRSQYSEIMQGTTYPMQVYCNGADTPWRSVTVIKLDGERYYRMHESASVTSQCKEIRRTQTFNGLN